MTATWTAPAVPKRWSYRRQRHVGPIDPLVPWLPMPSAAFTGRFHGRWGKGGKDRMVGGPVDDGGGVCYRFKD